MTQAVYLTMDHEDLSYHIVPSTPKQRQAVVCSSPAAIVPDLDTTNCRQPIFMILNTSPHPSLSIRVPSVSPKTPVVTRNTRREQLVPNRSPFARTTPAVSTNMENIKSDRGTCLEAIHLFSDDDNIFL